MNFNFNLAAERSREIVNAVLANLPNYILALLVVLIALVIGTFAARQVRRVVARTGAEYGVQSLLGSLSRIGFGVVGLMIGLGILGVDAGAIVAGAGVAGLVIGIAFRDILENFMAGILLLLRQPFTVGDTISTNGVDGLVTEINLRSTVLKTANGEEARVPNGAVLRSPILIKTAHPETRTVVEFRLPYDQDLGQAVEVIERAIGAVPDVRHDPAPEVAVVDYADGAVTLQVRFWTDSAGATVNRAGNLARLSIKQALDAAGIELASPSRAVLVRAAESAGRGDGQGRAAGEPQPGSEGAA